MVGCGCGAGGGPVLTLLAEDVDRNALLEYDIVEPISARDKTGNSLMNRVSWCRNCLVLEDCIARLLRVRTVVLPRGTYLAALPQYYNTFTAVIYEFS